jgi:cyclopropane fatty-acyl-phospholipid synthase-like methyltransferase
MILRIFEKQFRKPTGYWGNVVANKMLRNNRTEYEKIIETLEIKPHSKLFEIGYGPGYGLSRVLSEYNCTVTGLDYSELMYKRASKRNAIVIEKGRAELYYGNFLDEHWDFKDYDLVYCVNVVYFWDDLVLPFTKIRNMLSDDGAFCFYMVKPEFIKKQKMSDSGIFNYHTIEDAVAALEKAGFKNITYYYEDGYFVRAEK